MEIKDILKNLREKNHLTQEQMAERLVVTRQAVSRWETGETQPNTETLKLLSKEFDVSINTLLGMRIDLKSRKPVLAREMGGFSGPAVFPVALRAVYQIARAVDLPVVGCGGIRTAEDVLEMMVAGAKAVQIGSQNLVDPFACRDIIEALPATMEKYGIKNLREDI